MRQRVFMEPPMLVVPTWDARVLGEWQRQGEAQVHPGADMEHPWRALPMHISTDWCSPRHDRLAGRRLPQRGAQPGVVTPPPPHNVASVLAGGSWERTPVPLENADRPASALRTHDSRADVSDAVSAGSRQQRPDQGAGTCSTIVLARPMYCPRQLDERVRARQHRPCNGSPFLDR